MRTPHQPFMQVNWFRDDAFKAHLSFRNDRYVLDISSGVACSIAQIFRYRIGASSQKQVSCQIEQLADLSLSWLILHETSHVELGHFNFASSFGIAHRAKNSDCPLSLIPSEFHLHALPCLEMQADHEATEIMLGAYTTNCWTELRERVLAISGMMMLIERVDAESGVQGRTHPKAATRIFQLLAHLAEIPLIKAQVEEDRSLIPSEDELQAFAHEVTIPCFFDAIQLAQAARATSIADDLGSPEDFFKDLEIAKLGDPSRYGELKTQGAQEWAKLSPCNEALKPILGGHFTN